MSSTVQIVTVSYHSGEHLDALLASLDIDAPVVIANNAPEDLSVVERFGDRTGVSVVDLPNPGYGGAVNAALRAAPSDSPWVLVVNPDVRFHPGALDELLGVAERHPEAGVVGPLILTPSGEPYPSARRLPSLRTGIGHALFSRIWKGNPWTHAYLADRESPPRERTAGWLSGSCMLIRREAFDAVGGFDDSYFMYFEDVDLCRRIGKAGWTMVYAPSAVVTHVGGHATESRSAAMVRAHHDSAYLYLSRRYRGWYLAPLRLVLFVGLRARSRMTGGR